MSIIAGIIGSAVGEALTGTVPTGAVDVVDNSVAGLFFKTYSGYFSDDVNWFGSQSAISGGYTGTINNDGIPEYASYEYTGYFYANTTGFYKFRTTSDDASYFWIGSNAISGFTTGNADINNGELHGSSTVESSYYSLTAGKYYPIRVQVGNLTGGGVMILENSFNNGTWFITESLYFNNGGYLDGFNP